MELGPIQKEWIKTLREHPERQRKNDLGFKLGDNEQYCCLGQLLVCYNKSKGLKEEDYYDEKGLLRDKPSGDSVKSNHYPYGSYTEMGLITEKGAFLNVSSRVFIAGRAYDSLAKANDEGATWLEIADFVEQNPQLVFTKSV